MGTTEIGRMFGVSRQRADQLTLLEGFPRPAEKLAQGRVWRLEEVEAWARKTGRLPKI